MNKQLVTVIFLIVLCSLLIAPILLQESWTSQADLTPKQTPQTTLHPASPFTTPTLTAIPTNTIKPTELTPQTTPVSAMQASNRTLDEAIGNATSYLQNKTEPYALIWFDVIYRRFNITTFSDSLQQYDQALAQSSPEDQPTLRLFRRITDYNNPIQNGDLQAVIGETDKLTVPALYCNRYGLPSNYGQSLAQAANSQDYMITHALLATIWIHENSYNLPMPADFYIFLYNANSALIDTDEVVTDLELEAATFLYLSGQASMVNCLFIERVIAAQNFDGGWQSSNVLSEGSNWHSSVLGLILLLHQKYPAYSYPPMLALA